jgi:hypothetical protein
MNAPPQPAESFDPWNIFLASTDSLGFSARGCLLCNGPISISFDWVESLFNDEPGNMPRKGYYEKEFYDKLDDRRIEIPNFDPDDASEEDIAAVCGIRVKLMD